MINYAVKAHKPQILKQTISGVSFAILECSLRIGNQMLRSRGCVYLSPLVLLASHVDIIPTAVATMTQASRIVKFTCVRTLGGEILPTIERITLLTHPFSVVLVIQMRTPGNYSASSFGPHFLLLDRGNILVNLLL